MENRLDKRVKQLLLSHGAFFLGRSAFELFLSIYIWRLTNSIAVVALFNAIYAATHTLMFVIFAGTINLVMGSASAKWALLAPIFVPMFMFLGYTPELTQVIYRIGDSVTNIISPMMSFFALIIVYFQKYDEKAGIGTLVATMLPYSIVFFLGWVVLLIIWILTGIPLGPGAGTHL